MDQIEYHRIREEGMRRLAQDIDYLRSVVEVEDRDQALAILPYLIARLVKAEAK